MGPCLRRGDEALAAIFPPRCEGRGLSALAEICQGSYHGPMGGWVYIMTNCPHGTLYIGVTSDLAARVFAHREGRRSSFCRKHGLTRLVYAEHHDTITDAIIREKAMKKWKRQWKLRVIRAHNRDWLDLFETING